ncbi:TetR/AcrR family transcriptional regulator [Pseudarthrobacter sp. NIBRBAC000502770]|uniref:TetR/AcrR family transcriptional regulator n=1 Tax=Pseudarthrobacter sp. NIBRBAC000502770 TaxID=2590785 RepID=UPI00114068B4|nr:TetR/AcrR family transcriptional regulator [Pseudarthrobacter sp. NIBRBAC000502770]QDG87102.1 TetR/AcrR family transcriptional regulator [Pseudarthrobacter sp. NIBRBAC000502770]
MPKLWNETIDAHRGAVRDAILDATTALVSEHGLLSVTMSQIAQAVGIGRATLYKYFPNVEAILLAQHDRQLAGHLEHLAAATHAGGDAAHQLETVLHIHAMMTYEHHDSALATIMHHDGARQRQDTFIQDVLRRAAEAGAIRDDMAPQELASYCLHALAAAAESPSKAAVTRLVQLTLDSLRTRP